MAHLEETRWDKKLELPILEKWKKDKLYAFDENTDKPIFSVDTPPPYVNAPAHMGHASSYTITDMFARYKRMTGHAVIFPIGMDRNGLPIETAAEKKFKKRMHEVPREEFLDMCRAVLNDSSASSLNSFFLLGHSYSSWEKGPKLGDMYETDSPEYRTLTQNTFIDLWHKGLVYEDSRLNNYCPGCRTTLADSEIIRGEKETFLNDVLFTIKETGENVTIATTRPELLCNTAVIIYNPEDTRYTQLEGKHAVVPLYDLEVPFLAHPMADPHFGTGLVYMSKSAGDTDAIRFLIEQGIPTESCIDETGRMTEKAGFLKGMKTKEAREHIISMLKDKGLLTKQEKIMHSVPLCERSKDVIEFVSMPELYVKQTHVKTEMLELAKKLSFYSESSRQILVDWIEKIKIDWPVSRRRYYGTEIPLWYCAECKHPYVSEKGKYVQPWKEKCPAEKCEKCGHTKFVGETRVFDTWFDSSNSAAYVLGKGRHDDFFQKHIPCSLRPQGKEIIRTWLYYSMLKHYLLHDQLLFENVWINFHILDEKGIKMSKSLGNIIDPHTILERFGAEPFRLWMALEGNLAQTDLACSMERIDGAGKTLTKLWNVSRFVSQFEKPAEKPAQLMPLDEWVLSELNTVVKTAREGFEGYDYYSPSQAIRSFLWETFASHYLELVKHRAYNHENVFSKEESDSARYTLYACLQTLLQAWAPVIPIITEKLHTTLFGESVHAQSYPSPAEMPILPFTGEALQSLNSTIWKIKRDGGGNLKTPIKEAMIPTMFQSIEKDLKTAHGIEKLLYGDETRIQI